MTQAPLALLSVTDKTGLVEFARGLVNSGFALLSTGGTAKLLRENGVQVTDVAAYTGSPEILDGRVKTLHPLVHAGILFDRANPEHAAEAVRSGIRPIDLVVVNLYRFREEAVAKGLSRAAAIEHIDIGGPTMIRAAAKNWLHTAPVIDPADYPAVLAALRAGGLGSAERQRLAAKAFAAVSAYDRMIAEYLAGTDGTEAADGPLPRDCDVPLRKLQELRYGENPHQRAALYADTRLPVQGFADLQFLAGKELSYNNILDLDAAAALSAEFDEPAAVIVKHGNPCGVATSSGDESLADVFKRALACDPKSAFGGIVAVNRPVDKAAAEAITSLFTECVAAPDYSAEALAVLKQKPALRVLRAPFARRAAPGTEPEVTVRSVKGALLLQTLDLGSFAADDWTVATKAKPSERQLADLKFAMIVAKHVKSNAIVFVKDGATVGVGAGQMSRIDSANIAVAKAEAEGRNLKGAVMASDAFFPFRDTVEFAAKHGVAAIVQPGGSKRDQDSVDAANAAGIAMVMTGERHFRH